jgi:hypothetical protein
LERINREMGAICSEREMDPRGSVPIDEMQARPSLPTVHPKVLEGLVRAERLLPTAREFVAGSLEQLARENHIERRRVQAAILRVRAVNKVKPEMDLRDNASVYYQNQRTIHFGTIFLASLQSDEGMISILAHELTHIADGRGNTLRPLFKVIAERAARATNLEIDGGRPEELTCDLVGVMVANKLIDTTPNQESFLRRLARSIEHNCVTRDDTDEAHLSPRNTMRAILAVEPMLAEASTQEIQ